MKVSNVFKKNLNEYVNGTRIILNQGGTSSTKTYSLLQLAYILAQKTKKNKLISIMGPNLPHIRRGALRDFIHILEDEGTYSENNYNKSNLTFKIGNSEIEFFSSDQPGKVRGPRRDILIVNELNLINKETFEQAVLRTKECVFADYNPVSQFYAHTDYLTRSDCTLIKSTFRDNPFLSQTIVDEILSRKNNANWWRVYGEGEVGQVEGLIYPNWSYCKNIPLDAKLIGYGMDFGYSTSYTAIVAIYTWRGEIILDELIYRKGLLSGDMIDLMKQKEIKKTKPIIADSEDPRLIAEISKAGFICRAVKKPKVYTRIEKALNYKLHITSTSVNLAKEFNNYMWDQDKNGNYIHEPVKAFDHGMDAWGYAVWTLVGKTNFGMF